MSNWPLAFMELAIVLAFAAGWLILEWQGRRLDRQRRRVETPGSLDKFASKIPFRNRKRDPKRRRRDLRQHVANTSVVAVVFSRRNQKKSVLNLKKRGVVHRFLNFFVRPEFKFIRPKTGGQLARASDFK